jgi:opacity protein-like surface antigen
MKKIYIALFIILFGASSGFSQAFWTVSYDIGLPVGEFADFIPKASFRGFSINGNGYLTDNITLGGTFHWSGYYEHLDRDTYQLEDGALTSEIWKKTYFSVFTFNARYMFKPEGSISPYVGLGMGPYHVEQSTQAGAYISTSKNWKFGLTPDAGVFLPFGGSDWGLNVRATYNAVFYNLNDINTLSYFHFSVGVGWYAW